MKNLKTSQEQICSLSSFDNIAMLQAVADMGGEYELINFEL